jgi:hypothetical protein
MTKLCWSYKDLDVVVAPVQERLETVANSVVEVDSRRHQAVYPREATRA